MRTFALLALALCATASLQRSHASGQTQTPIAPDWAQPGSATHKQVPPPTGFHRATRTDNTPIGIFSGQSDVGAALVPGSATFNPSTNEYTITSAGYNIWYSRDEFRYLWKQMSGDVSLAANITFPTNEPPSDRKAVLVIRQSLNDDSPEAVAAEHATGMVHLAMRDVPSSEMKDMQFRFGGALLLSPMPQRIGIEKHGDDFSLFVSLQGEPMHQFGPPMHLHLAAPFYVGIGFTSHLPTTLDTGALSNVVLENRANAIH